MPGPSDEDLALAYWFLKSKQDRMSEQKKKVKKLQKFFQKYTSYLGNMIVNSLRLTL